MMTMSWFVRGALGCTLAVLAACAATPEPVAADGGTPPPGVDVAPADGQRGADVAELCADECAAGARRCAAGGWQTCTVGADGCARWGAATACPAGESCSDGACAASCVNECTLGARECAGRTGYRECGNFDADACLEWGPATPCPADESCALGACVAGCQDECTAAGARQCTSAATGYQACGDYDGDGCLEWGPAVACGSGETCSGGVCAALCACDFYDGVCEPQSPGSTVPCACDPDCAGGALPCTHDGHCDTWCPPETDPDCECACQHNEYCEAAAPGESATCACDPDCGLHDVACADDGHCDTYCPPGADPDCGADACRERWLDVGWRWGSELALSGVFDAPDPAAGDPAWVLLSADGWAGGGSGEILVSFAAEHRACMQALDVEVYGYDDSLLGSGAKLYLWNWSTSRYDLLPQALGSDEGWYENIVEDPAPYLACGSGPRARCFADARVSASTWDNSHVLWVALRVFMQP
jgi:hypothetical protein